MYDNGVESREARALDRVGKRTLRIAAVAAILPFLLLLVPIAQKGFYVGQWLKGGDAALAASAGFGPLFSSTGFAIFIFFAMLSTIVGATAWWRYSGSQDEAFQWAQKFVFARLGLCAAGAVFLWWMASLPGWVGPLPLEDFIYFGLVLFSLTSADAQHRLGRQGRL